MKFGDMYIQTLALKYPMMARNVNGMKNLDKRTLNKRLTNLNHQSQRGENINYMNEPATDPVQREIYKFYSNP